jgi:hypothetical protein
MARFLHDEFTKLEPDAEISLSGSRVDENKIPCAAGMVHGRV